MWLVDLRPVRGHEQGEQRPAVIVSATRFNRSAAELVIVAPITRTDRRVPLHVRVDPPAGGLKASSFVLCDQLRCISIERLVRRWGHIPTETMREVADRIRIVLDLDV